MRVLVACEFSGAVRDAFKARGHDAWSCDVLPTERPGQHHQGDVLAFIRSTPRWDLMVAHPPCTYLCNSGVRWLYERPGRLQSMREAAAFFDALYNAPVDGICIENPIPHKHANLRPYTQVIQPWQFGHGETKATCLWLRGLPPLRPTRVVRGRAGKIHSMPPGPNRGRERSRTYPGIARAMANQWG
jgi:hypothetical protein